MQSRDCSAVGKAFDAKARAKKLSQVRRFELETGDSVAVVKPKDSSLAAGQVCEGIGAYKSNWAAPTNQLR